MTTNRFTARLSDSDDYRRELLIQKIAHAVEQLKLSELEALSYDMFTKGYMKEGEGRLGGGCCLLGRRQAKRRICKSPCADRETCSLWLSDVVCFFQAFANIADDILYRSLQYHVVVGL